MRILNLSNKALKCNYIRGMNVWQVLLLPRTL